MRPAAADGLAAARAARSADRRCGNLGAGTGATIAKLAGGEWALKGGLGTASERLESGAVVGALAVVNAFGAVVRPEDGAVIAGARAAGGGFRDPLALLRARRRKETPPLTNTTIAVVATDQALSRDALRRVALMAHAGLARTLLPSHTPADGDTVFALATGLAPASDEPDVLAIGAFAARALERAIIRAVLAAEPLAGMPSVRQWREHAPTANSE